MKVNYLRPARQGVLTARARIIKAGRRLVVGEVSGRVALVVDDLGRQRVPVRDLLNRWVVPLEHRQDGMYMGKIEDAGPIGDAVVHPPDPVDVLLVVRARTRDERGIAAQHLADRLRFEGRGRLHCGQRQQLQHAGVALVAVTGLPAADGVRHEHLHRLAREVVRRRRDDLRNHPADS